MEEEGNRKLKCLNEREHELEKVSEAGIRIPSRGVRSIPRCFQQDDYELLYKIGEGTFGEVHKARERTSERLVALKRLRTENEKEGFPRTALRELLILMNYRHKNIMSCDGMTLMDYQGKKTFSMIFEYMDHDLTGLLENPAVKFTTSQIKCYLKQLLEGVAYLHENKVIHRDIKGSNVLINNRGELKLGDFGLARLLDEHQRHRGDLTNQVVTLWYRAPELLLGSKFYSDTIDVWSVGCIFAEMLLKKPLFPGKDEMDQLQKICQLCGTPSEETWPNLNRYPFFRSFKLEPRPSTFFTEFSSIRDPMALDLLQGLLTLNPEKRCSSRDALGHAYFTTQPLPTDPRNLPQYLSSHEMDRRKAPERERIPMQKDSEPESRVDLPPKGFFSLSKIPFSTVKIDKRRPRERRQDSDFYKRGQFQDLDRPDETL